MKRSKHSISLLGLTLTLILVTLTGLSAAGQRGLASAARLFGVIHPNEILDNTILNQIDVLVPSGWYIQPDGAIGGAHAKGINPNDWGYQVVPLVTNVSPFGDITSLGDAGRNAQIAAALAAQVRDAGFEGALLDLDFAEGGSAGFTDIVAQVAAAFDEAGFPLGVVIHIDRFGDYDLAALNAADLIFLQGLRPSDEPDDILDAIDPRKAGLMIDTRSIDASDAGDIPVGYRQALAPFAGITAPESIPPGEPFTLEIADAPAFDASTASYTYPGPEGGEHTVYIAGAGSLAAMLEQAGAYGFAAALIDGLFHEDPTPGLVDVLAAYRAGAPVGEVPLPALYWYLAASPDFAAPLLAEPYTGAPLTARIDAPGAYYAAVGVQHGAGLLPLATATITVAEPPTATPDPRQLTAAALETARVATSAALTATADTWTDTPTPSLTPTPTLAPTETLLPTEPPTATATFTPLPTDTPPSTATPTGTPTPLPSPTLTPTPTVSFTPSPTILPATSERLPDPKPSLTPVPDALARIMGDQNLNLRAGPGTEYPVVGFVEPGDIVPVKGRTLAPDPNERPWLLIEVDGIPAWIASWLVELDTDINALGIVPAPSFEDLTLTPPFAAPLETSTPIVVEDAAAQPGAAAGLTRTPLPLPAGAVVAIVRTEGGRLNVRSGPSQYFDQIGYLGSGDAVEILARTESGPWYKINFQGAEEAWIAGWLTDVQGDIAGVPLIAQEDAPELPPDVVVPESAPVFSGGTASGGFELGGHVANFGAVGHMKTAGMTWAKVQVRYNLGDGPGNAAGPIGEAHGSGLKILLGIVGDPNQIAAAGLDSYIQQFAAYLGGVASLGPDAIEVWNEMNLDREWPTGQIDPAAYTRMLAAAYNAIKGANPGVMVISGAPSPTGAEGAFGTDRAWNDDRYYAGMAAAGAVNYMDCIGAHYNEGIVPPSWSSGDPRDNYPTRFLPGMIQRASAPFGGARPVCFTELGYLSPEGYGQLSSGFAWAQQVTVAQQAAWLAEAAVIASRSHVRLMIVWNVNFTNFGVDPMAGYAIVRPGGGCPACITLGQAMGQ
ncbi:MAG: SH3 domain-containing protein [Anaerolineae bacterium]|nr:SH3 domain-containing protein [Anaerolineae bacterium]